MEYAMRLETIEVHDQIQGRQVELIAHLIKEQDAAYQLSCPHRADLFEVVWEDLLVHLTIGVPAMIIAKSVS